MRRAVLVAVGVLVASRAAAAEAALELHAPPARATGVETAVRVTGAPPAAPVRVEERRGDRWRLLAGAQADAGGRVAIALRSPLQPQRWRLRAAAGDAVGQPARVRVRHVRLDAVGDINLGDGPGHVMALRGPAWPWTGVGRVLRAADIAFGNLECAVSRRGRPVPKTYNFRSPPSRLRPLRAVAGFDVLSLANNHVGDYGPRAAADTVRNVRRAGIVPVGAGRNLELAARARVVRRLGLRVAFVAFSDIPPFSFGAGAESPGTRLASPGNVRRDVRAARRLADVVVVSMHWGIEYDPRPPSARQRLLARAALRAGADAVIGAHPHVLQPIRARAGHRLVAYSLGNFVFSPRNGWAARTGILTVRLSGRGVERARLRRATIREARPRLDQAATGTRSLLQRSASV